MFYQNIICKKCGQKFIIDLIKYGPYQLFVELDRRHFHLGHLHDDQSLHFLNPHLHPLQQLYKRNTKNLCIKNCFERAQLIFHNHQTQTNRNRTIILTFLKTNIKTNTLVGYFQTNKIY